MAHDIPEVDLEELLSAAESVSPAAAVTAVARHLRDRLGVERVSFWIGDAAGQALIRMPDGERRPTDGTALGGAWREQRITVDGSVCVPVTVRGDALGVLEVRLPGDDPAPQPGMGMRRALTSVAHCLGYVIVANQRLTDAFEVARRSEPFDLSMEIQRRLLPQAFVCEGGSFSLAGWLEPSATAGGDTFDYVASADRLTVALVDALGHDVTASLLATLTVNAIRNARRGGASVVEQAAAADAALQRYARPEQYATGLLLEAPLVAPIKDAGPGERRPVTVRLVNAGHPPLRLVRDGRVSRIELPPSTPFGIRVRGRDKTYPVQELELRPGDRLVLLTDGMYERWAGSFPLDEILLETAHCHPRNAVQDVASRFRTHVREQPPDDATLLVLDWYGGTTGRSANGGADTG
ncbi:MAG TPA: PP2C family protein-serine/threonine phosphatase [Marmoricola sp.]